MPNTDPAGYGADAKALSDPIGSTLEDVQRPGYERAEAARRQASGNLKDEPEDLPVKKGQAVGSGMRGRAPGLPGAA